MESIIKLYLRNFEILQKFYEPRNSEQALYIFASFVGSEAFQAKQEMKFSSSLYSCMV